MKGFNYANNPYEKVDIGRVRQGKRSDKDGN